MHQGFAAGSCEEEGGTRSRGGARRWLSPLAPIVVLAATFVDDNSNWLFTLPFAAAATLCLIYWSTSLELACACCPWRRRLPSGLRANSHGGERAGDRGRPLAAGSPPARRGAQQAARRPAVAKPELRQDSKVPVRAPTFTSQGYGEQVAELLAQVAPTEESERLAQQLAQCAKAAIQKVFPEADVVGFASGDVTRGTAFGVAVPELELVASASSQMLVEHLQGRLSKGGLSMAKLDARKLQKSAIRVCTDYLVSEGGFKFRRSAFRGQEPKVTLMAPPSLQASSNKRIAVDFSVNSMTPLYNAALMNECGRLDLRAKSLILLVRRWAKDRGVCHAAKGHLAPYAWTLLAIYFLQTVGAEGSPVLPPLLGSKTDSGVAVRRGAEPGARRSGGKSGSPAEVKTLQATEAPAAELLVGDLFVRFVRFYAQEFDWCKEAVSVRVGRRASANLHLMLHVIVHEDQSTEVGPSIEDPFEPARNLGMSTTSVGMARLREEFARAWALTSRGASLSELLEPWAPAERAQGCSSDEGGDREE